MVTTRSMASAGQNSQALITTPTQPREHKPKPKPKPKKTRSKSTPQTTNPPPKKKQKRTPRSPPHPTDNDDDDYEEPTNPDPNRKSFLDLPPELRNEIYSHILPQSEPIAVSPNFPHFRRPRILSANRQIRREAFEMFYGNNHFQIQGSALCVRFLRSVSDDILRCLRCVRVMNSDTAKVEDHSAAWLTHVRQRVEHLQREPGKRGLRLGAIHYPLTVDGGLMWANVRDLDGVAVDAYGRLTMRQGSEDSS